MARKKKFTDPTDIEIVEIHGRFVEVMENVRLETISPEMKQRYLAVMKSLTEKLAMPSKPLSRSGSGVLVSRKLKLRQPPST